MYKYVVLTNLLPIVFSFVVHTQREINIYPGYPGAL